MNGQDIPDSWDDTGVNGDIAGSVATSFSQLNVAAKPFVPNVNAPAFVPSFKRSPPVVQHDAKDLTVAEPGVEQGDSLEISHNDLGTAEAAQMEVAEPIPISENLGEVHEDVGDKSVKEETEEVKEIILETPVSEEQEKPTPPQAPSSAPNTQLKEDHLNVVFIGHVDAGKSTIGGQIMYLTGMVDKRTLEKYEREAKEKNRETWYLSWALDTNQEERDKGKTVEVGRAYFETETKHFTILDAPGHRSFVPNMIGGASQADIAVLVISARRGEFETGFERGGQTREHAMLAKTAGVQHLVVLINKMDDPTVQWSQARYEECKDKLTPFLKKVGFNPKKDVHFMPCSGLAGTNLKEPDYSKHPWYTDLPLIPYLDNLPTVSRSGTGPVRLPVVDKYKDMGVIAIGKIESGKIFKGQTLVLQPNKKRTKGTIWYFKFQLLQQQAVTHCSLLQL